MENNDSEVKEWWDKYLSNIDIKKELDDLVWGSPFVKLVPLKQGEKNSNKEVVFLKCPLVGQLPLG